MINIGDIVSRNKYNNDMLFKVIKIENDVYYLSGIEIRLCADSELSDLRKEDNIDISEKEDERILKSLNDNLNEQRDDYFYIYGRILQLDSDNTYLQRCLKFYKNAGLNAYGVNEKEENLYKNMTKYLEDIKPDILIITGHDAYYKMKGSDEKAYKNSDNFAKAIAVARKYEKSYDKLKIIAGACQSNYEELINAGANFASSPKRVNIHALDPAIIAVSISKTENNKELNIIDILNKTKCGKEGIGGIKTYGSMYVGYPK